MTLIKNILSKYRSFKFKRGFYEHLLNKLYDFSGPSLPTLLGFGKEWETVNKVYKYKRFETKKESAEYKIKKLVRLVGTKKINNSIKQAYKESKIDKKIMQTLITGAGAEYGKQLNNKYENKNIKFKAHKFKKAMDYYGINVKIKELDTKGEFLVLECNDCIFDYLKNDLISFCNYSEAFFRTYFNAEVTKMCKTIPDGSCQYNIKTK